MERERSKSASGSVPVRDERRTAQRVRRPGDVMRREGGPLRPMMWDPWASPFELMRQYMREMNRAFEGWGYPGQETGLTMANWPPIEIVERGGRMVVRAEVPGINKDDIHVRIDEDSLVIEGERKSGRETRQEGYYESEWSYGRFARRIPLPAHVDPEQVTARFENGVLEVELPLPAPSAREIPIRSGASREAATSGPAGSAGVAG